MTVLITGDSGYIGSFIKKELSETRSVFGISEIMDSVFFDLSKTENISLIQQKIGNKKIDVLIHLASIVANGSDLNSIEIINQNNSISINVVNLAKELGVNQFINFSSTAVYPNIDGTYNELSEINPAVNKDCFYGLSKFNSEVIANYLLGNNGVKVVNLRPAYVLEFNSVTKGLFYDFVNEIKEKNTITIYGYGKRLINFTSRESILQKIEKAIENKSEGVFNVIDQTVSINDLAQKAKELYGNNNTSIIYLKKVKDTFFKVESIYQ